jgi:hypothetical protein
MSDLTVVVHQARRAGIGAELPVRQAGGTNREYLSASYPDESTVRHGASRLDQPGLEFTVVNWGRAAYESGDAAHLGGGTRAEGRPPR